MRQEDMRQEDMREVDAILGKFPGPVTLTVSRRKKLLGLAISLGFTLSFVWILFFTTGTVSGWYDTMMSWITLVFFGVLAVRAMILLLVPAAASLTLDAQGFEINSIFWYVHTPWRHMRRVRVRKIPTQGNLPMVVYEVRASDAPKVIKTLPDNYQLSDHDLAWLLEQWRERALGRS